MSAKVTKLLLGNKFTDRVDVCRRDVIDDIIDFNNVVDDVLSDFVTNYNVGGNVEHIIDDICTVSQSCKLATNIGRYKLIDNSINDVVLSEVHRAIIGIRHLYDVYHYDLDNHSDDKLCNEYLKFVDLIAKSGINNIANNNDQFVNAFKQFVESAVYCNVVNRYSQIVGIHYDNIIKALNVYKAHNLKDRKIVKVINRVLREIDKHLVFGDDVRCLRNLKDDLKSINFEDNNIDQLVDICEAGISQYEQTVNEFVELCYFKDVESKKIKVSNNIFEDSDWLNDRDDVGEINNEISKLYENVVELGRLTYRINGQPIKYNENSMFKFGRALILLSTNGINTMFDIDFKVKYYNCLISINEQIIVKCKLYQYSVHLEQIVQILQKINVLYTTLVEKAVRIRGVVDKYKY